MDVELFKTLVKEGLSLAILLPIVWYFLNKDSKSTSELVKALREGFDKVEHAIATHDEKTEKQFFKTQFGLANTALDEDKAVQLLVTQMFYTSRGKLEFIRNILKINHIEGREEEVKEQVKSELSRRSVEGYMSEFAKYITPVGDLSVWLENNFTEDDFSKFVADILRIMYTKKYEQEGRNGQIELKVNDVAILMTSLQDRLANKLRKDIRSSLR